MPNIPIPYRDDLTYDQVHLLTGLSKAAIAAQANSGHVTAATSDPETGEPRVTRASVARFIADRSPGGEFAVGGRRS